MKYKEYLFDFEKLEVYQRAIEFTNLVFERTRKFHWEYQSSLGDQMRRASLSICNNIAEGNRKSPKSKRQFYEYALDSARECIPMITLAVKQKQLSRQDEDYFRDECIQIGNMLYKLKCSVRI